LVREPQPAGIGHATDVTSAGNTGCVDAKLVQKSSRLNPPQRSSDDASKRHASAERAEMNVSGRASSAEKRRAPAKADAALTPVASVRDAGGVLSHSRMVLGDPRRQRGDVTLSAAGFYNMSHEFRKDVPTKTKMFQ